MMYTLWSVVKYVALRNSESFGEVLLDTCATAVYSVIARVNGWWHHSNAHSLAIAHKGAAVEASDITSGGGIVNICSKGA